MFDLFGIVTRILLAAPTATATVPAKPVAVVTAPTTAAASLSATDVVDKVQAFYVGINQVTAKFRQTVTNATFGTSKDSDGTIYLLKPGKMRWNYLQKHGKQVTLEKEFVSDGATLFVIDHANKQIIQQAINTTMMPVAVSFLYGKGDLKTDFNAAFDKSNKFGTAAEYTLLLTPKQPSAQYKNLILVVNKQDFHVSQSIIIDSANNVNQIRFFAPDFKASVAASLFVVNTKSPGLKNYRIVTGTANPAGAAADAPIPPAPTGGIKPTVAPKPTAVK